MGLQNGEGATGMRIRVLVTGGTFDKEYDELTGRLLFLETHVPEMLRRGRARLDLDIETVMMIDSLEMTDPERARIVQRCRDSSEHAIIVTHGTDTMVETAATLAQAGLEGKTIVLTGAMVPYAFGSSDGLFNLGSALSFVQVLPPGVYIAMNGQHFRWNQCRKNRETGVFERTVKE
jgi:L-asparaginase